MGSKTILQLNEGKIWHDHGPLATEPPINYKHSNCDLWLLLLVIVLFCRLVSGFIASWCRELQQHSSSPSPHQIAAPVLSRQVPVCAQCAPCAPPTTWPDLDPGDRGHCGQGGGCSVIASTSTGPQLDTVRK